METGWVTDTDDDWNDDSSQVIVGRTHRVWKFVFGTFYRMDGMGDVLCFINVSGSRLGFVWRM